MDALKQQCWFNAEQAAALTTSHVDLPLLDSYVARGRATLSTVSLFNSQTVLSVSVKDGSQGDVLGLPCGARSLLLEPAAGAIVCRGINKFFDVTEVGDAWLHDAALWSDPAYRVWAVRKMAGFVVTVFSLDGVRLELMSKHVLAGPHVDCARQLLDALPAPHRAQMAADLFAWSACASFECIRRAEDRQHPVLEAAIFDEQLVLFAVQQRARLREQSVPVEKLTALGERWGVTSAPTVELSSSEELANVFEAVQTWDAVYPPFTSCPQLAEGFVLLIETMENQLDCVGGMPWCFPLRLKLKTPKYVVLRAFRSLVLGDSQPQSYVYHQALLGWLQPCAPATIRARLNEGGVYELSAQFEAAMQAKGRLRHRDARESVSCALARLHACTVRAANPRVHCPLHVLLFCGLPGAGKTTMAKALVQRLITQADLPFRFVLHLSRDATSRDTAAKNGIDESSSKHKQRRLRALVHWELCNDLRAVAAFCAETQQRGLLLFDACNATQASRQVWRQCLPALVEMYKVVHVECADAAVSASRAGHREHHEVLRSAAEAQHALYTVKKKFQAPAAVEQPWYVDTSAQTVEEAAGAVYDLLVSEKNAGSASDHPETAAAAPPRLVSVAALREEMRESRAALLHSLLGLSADAAAQLEDVGALLSTEKKPHIRSLQVRLNCSLEALRGIAADVLCPTLGVAVETSADSFLAIGRRLVQRVAAVLWSSTAQATTTSVAGRIVRGHAKWLRGWLLHGTTASSLSDVASALEERFEQTPPTPHVTLLHVNGGRRERDGPASHAAELSSADIAHFLAASALRVGETVTVRVTSVLVDRHALCFGVILGNGQREQGCVESAQGEGDAGKIPLHITVGTAAGVAASHAGGMFADFEVWQQENEALQTEQLAPQRPVIRSQRKFHNFVEYSLDTEVELTGVVELHME